MTNEQPEAIAARLTFHQVLALSGYAAGYRANLTATALSAARTVLSAARLVRNCDRHEGGGMLVTATPLGRAVLAAHAALPRPRTSEQAALW